MEDRILPGGLPNSRGHTAEELIALHTFSVTVKHTTSAEYTYRPTNGTATTP